MINENILIYGATGGIGQAVCKELRNRGGNLFLLVRSVKKGNLLKNELQLKSSQILCINSITSKSDYNQVLTWLKKHGLMFSIGIHAAGKGLMKKASAITLDEWHDIIELNLTSAFTFYRLIWEVRNPKKCELVYFGSASIDEVWPKNCLYGACKAGLETFAKSLQKEIRSEGGRVWLYKPGSVRTGFFDKVKSHLPKEKMISPQVLAKIVVDNLNMASDIYYPPIAILSD